jgi:glycosyltransferase involved in cell wall biosynthesis
VSKVSLIIPTYNCGQYISQAIESALKQTYKDIEIIVVDDGSTDYTREVLKPYVTKRICQYIYQSNQGVAKARNTGILAAKGEYIAYVDADDEMDKRMIAVCIEALAREKTDWCITDILRIESKGDDDRTRICKTIVPKNPEMGILKNDFSLRSPFFRKETLLGVGLYDASLLTREDWDMNIRLIQNSKFFSYIPEPLYIYKIRSNSLMKNNNRKSCDSTLKLLKKHHKKIADACDREVAQIYAHHLWRLGKAYFTDVHDLKSSVACIAESMKYDFNIKRLTHPFYFHIAKHFGRQ